jgi:hypothetical protein
MSNTVPRKTRCLVFYKGRSKATVKIRISEEKVMRISAVILLLIMPVLAVAKNYPGMSDADMQKIQKMQSCIERVGQKQLKAFEQRQAQFDAEMKSLCARDKGDEAQKKPLDSIRK